MLIYGKRLLRLLNLLWIFQITLTIFVIALKSLANLSALILRSNLTMNILLTWIWNDNKVRILAELRWNNKVNCFLVSNIAFSAYFEIQKLN